MLNDCTAVECNHEWIPNDKPNQFYSPGMMFPLICSKCGKTRLMQLPHSPVEGALQEIAEKLDRIAGYLFVLARNADEEREWKEIMSILRNCDLRALGNFLTDQGIITALRGKAKVKGE